MSEPDAFVPDNRGCAAVGLSKGDVDLRAHDPAWLRLGEQERRRVAHALDGIAHSIEHVGSTAVPGLWAKPIIDIAVSLPHDGPSQESSVRERMIIAGYIDRGVAADGGGWLFVRELKPDVRAAHIHLVVADDPEWNRYLIFRDALRADQRLRDRYTELKRQLAKRYPHDRVAYTNAKTGFVCETVREHQHRSELGGDAPSG
jgi:GrpB-like predicted nucleotidyltransferase (UPF0157 family)